MIEWNKDTKSVKCSAGAAIELDHIWKPDYDYQRNPYERTKRTVLKIWDHMNLAKR